MSRFNVDGNSAERDPNDFYETPARFTEALLLREKFNPAVWEPAAGKGAIMDVLKHYKYKVASSDLFPRRDDIITEDFLKSSHRGFDIVTNPPFKLLTEFAEHAFKLCYQKFAFVMPLGGLGSSGRYQRIYTKMPVKAIYLTPRGQLIMTAKGPLQSHFMHVWLVVDKEHVGPTKFAWLEDGVFKWSDSLRPRTA
jgi:hypothetical protein